MHYPTRLTASDGQGTPRPGRVSVWSMLHALPERITDSKQGIRTDIKMPPLSTLARAQTLDIVNSASSVEVGPGQ